VADSGQFAGAFDQLFPEEDQVFPVHHRTGASGTFATHRRTASRGEKSALTNYRFASAIRRWRRILRIFPMGHRRGPGDRRNRNRNRVTALFPRYNPLIGKKSLFARNGRSDFALRLRYDSLAPYGKVQKSEYTFGGSGESIMRWVNKMPITFSAGSTQAVVANPRVQP
jgi:hypothetical protein